MFVVVREGKVGVGQCYKVTVENTGIAGQQLQSRSGEMSKTNILPVFVSTSAQTYIFADNLLFYSVV